jgi:uncharacterized membrane protein
MPDLASSLARQSDEVERANRMVTSELWAAALFLVGLVLVVVAVVLLATVFVSRVLPEEADPSVEIMFPQLTFGVWPVVIGVLVFLFPAGLLMYAGVVFRRFLEKE